MTLQICQHYGSTQTTQERNRPSIENLLIFKRNYFCHSAIIQKHTGRIYITLSQIGEKFEILIFLIHDINV